MTTAHRATWKAAVGQKNTGGWTAGGTVSTQTAARDAPSHMSLKYREKKVDKAAALKESLMALTQAEASAPVLKRTFDPEEEEKVTRKLLTNSADVDEEKIKAQYDDSDVGDDSESESDLDAEESDDDDSSDSEDEDDEAALQAELAKIRAEREEAKRKAEEEATEEEHAKEEEAALLGNPLLNADMMKKKKRAWNDDIVFRNQAKGEPEVKKRFINDTVRNDFHKRFLKKFIR